MKITIIETGKPPPPLDATWPTYPEMFAAGLSNIDAETTFDTIDLISGQTLPDPSELEAVLITGSPVGVYDDIAWVKLLLNYVGWLGEACVPTVGICFGHQVIAKALGGTVEKSEKGWGIGRHTYDIAASPNWLADKRAQFSLAVSHQDQVILPPRGAKTIGASAFTPYAALEYAQAPMISFQGHPEFSAAYAAALYDLRKGSRIPEALVNDAYASLNTTLDNDFVLHSSLNYLRQNKKTF